MKTNPFGYSVKKSPSGGYTVISLSYTPPDKKGKSQMIKIAPELGSNLFSWRWDGHEIMYHEPNLLKHCGFTGNFVLFPTPNRVRNSTYLWKGKRSIMKKRGKIIELHGLVFDESWKHTAPVIKKDCVCLQTSIRITRQSALFNAFPFPCALTLEYRVYSNRIRISYTVKNQGATALPFGFGLHPYFSRLSGNDKTFITIPAESWMESPSETLLPTGKLISVAGKSYDVRTATPVGKLSLDHVYTNLAPSRFATIEYRTLGF
jgi:aldose 1-epimerase